MKEGKLQKHCEQLLRASNLLPYKATQSLTYLLDAMLVVFRKHAHRGSSMAKAYFQLCCLQTGIPFLKLRHRKLWAEYFNNILYTIEVVFKYRKQKKAAKSLNIYDYPNLPLAQCPDLSLILRERVPAIGYKPN